MKWSEAIFGKTFDPSGYIGAAPEMSKVYGDWQKLLPSLFNMQQDYGRQMAEQNFNMMQRYAPIASSLGEQLAAQAQQGMQAGVPDYMRNQYLDELRANLGTNVGSPIGAEYTSRNMLNQAQGYRNYYQNMAQQLSGRTQLFPQQTLDMLSSFTPETALGYASNTYGSKASAISGALKPAGDLTQGIGLQGLGSLMSGAGSIMGMIPGMGSTGAAAGGAGGASGASGMAGLMSTVGPLLMLGGG